MMTQGKRNQICRTHFHYPVVMKIHKQAITIVCFFTRICYSLRIQEASTSTQKTRLETRRPSNSKKIGPCKCVNVSAMIPLLLLSSPKSSAFESSEAVPLTSFFRFTFRRCLAVFSWRASFRTSSVHFSINPACGSRLKLFYLINGQFRNALPVLTHVCTCVSVSIFLYNRDYIYAFPLFYLDP